MNNSEKLEIPAEIRKKHNRPDGTLYSVHRDRSDVYRATIYPNSGAWVVGSSCITFRAITADCSAVLLSNLWGDADLMLDLAEHIARQHKTYMLMYVVTSTQGDIRKALEKAGFEPSLSYVNLVYGAKGRKITPMFKSITPTGTEPLMPSINLDKYPIHDQRTLTPGIVQDYGERYRLRKDDAYLIYGTGSGCGDRVVWDFSPNVDLRQMITAMASNTPGYFYVADSDEKAAVIESQGGVPVAFYEIDGKEPRVVYCYLHVTDRYLQSGWDKRMAKVAQKAAVVC